MSDKQELFRNLPSVDQLLKHETVEALLNDHPRRFVLKAVRDAIDGYREQIRAGQAEAIDVEAILDEIRASVDREASLRLRPVINATGIVMHTNLGRAPLPKRVLDNVVRIAEGYSNLEYDLGKGTRGKRYSHIKGIINEITGAEDCLVVNNNAAAVFLCLGALARGKEVIVSRGELVEIGGSFRVPDVMIQSGAVLREVGTTNKTHDYDYENAVTPGTGMILKVHKSNFRVTGFVEDVSIRDLAVIGKRHAIPVMYDLGSGCLADLRPLGVHDEPTVQEIVAAGVDLTTFSGDKLLGGPQAGIIVGRADLIATIRRHPLTRALRVDKFTLSALESTFMLYADMEKAKNEIPVLKMLFASEEGLKVRARRLAGVLKKADIPAEVAMHKDSSKAGGGAIPEVEFVTWTVSIVPRAVSVNALEERLRRGPVSVIGRIQDDRFILDVRTIKPSQFPVIRDAMAAALAPPAP